MSQIKTSLKPNSGANLTNLLDFVMDQKLAHINTCKPVKVIAVNGGTVDVELAVQGLDFSTNQPMPPVKIFEVPILQFQSGAFGLELIPSAGDFGIAVFSDSDISKFVSKGETAPIASFRKFDYSDCFYLGACLHKEALTTTISLTKDGITIKSDKEITLNSDNTVNITGAQGIEMDSNQKIVIKAGADGLGDIVQSVCRYLLAAMMKPAVPGAPLDPAAAAEITPLITKLSQFYS